MEVINTDAVLGMRELKDDSIHLALTSFPYDDLRTYKKNYQWDFYSTCEELYRVLCKGGVFISVIADQTKNGAETLTSARQAIHLVDKVGFKLHDTMIYQKLNFSNPEKKRYHNVFEYIYVFSKGKPRCFNPIKDRKNVTAGQLGSLGKNTCTQVDGSKVIRKRKVNTEFGMRHNVWLGKTRGQEEMCKKLPHPAMMPKWLARDLIISFSNPGDIVLDPYAGSCTVGQQAELIGREAIMIEENTEYLPANYENMPA